MDFEEYWDSLEYGENDDPTLVMHCRHVAFGAWRLATNVEREACAKVAEDFDFNERPEIEPPRSLPRYVAQAIRVRSNG